MKQKQAKAIFKKSKKDSKWYWSLTQPNGRKTADGCQGYKTIQGAIKGFNSTAKKIITAKRIIIK
jgi:uncharacterized protein YegP (UPF0339 family)